MKLDPLMASVVLGFCRIGFSLSTFAFVSIASKRTVMYICAATGTICQLLGSSHYIIVTNYLALTFDTIIIVAIYSHVSETVSPNPKWFVDLGWVPLAACLGVTATLPIINGIYDTLLGEVFPTETRTASMGIVKAVEWSAFGVTTILFPYLMKWIHFYGLNYYYAFISLALVFWTSTIKNTDGLSLVEIEQIYCSRRGISSVEIIASRI